MSKYHDILNEAPHGTRPARRYTPSPSADLTEGDVPTRQPRTDLKAGDMLGGYRIEKMLGMGGMGAVYLVTDTHLGRRVAVKTVRADMAVDPGLRERFFREARAAAAIDHENVVPVYAVGEAAGCPYLVMPLLKGEALDARLQRGAWPSVAETCRFACEVAAGLAAAHAAGVIHRDVKPSNVWLDGTTGRARLLDFGLARPTHGGEALTRAGVVMGTPSYMAPEQAAGGVVDHRADLFSLGVLLYELTTRRRPFVGDSALAVLTALAVHDPLPAHEVNPAVPAALSKLIGRLLAKTLPGRPGSAAEVCTALAAIEAAQPAIRSRHLTSAPPAQTHPPGWRRTARALLSIVLGGAAALTPMIAREMGLEPNWTWAALAVGVGVAVLCLPGRVVSRGR